MKVTTIAASPVVPGKEEVQAARRARIELLVRYGASYACTLIAIMAAQLYIANSFAALLGGVTLLGIPISLYLRRSRLRFFGRPIRRLFVNSTVVIATGLACLYLLFRMQKGIFSRGAYETVMISHSATDSIAILMSMFLIFAAVRSLAVINDKDAVLSTVPSFSVLLLLIVVHRGPAVVLYFLLWAVAAAVLFAMDHRQESHKRIDAIIPSIIPGQAAKLSIHSLVAVMGFSLFCSVTISYWLSSRNPEERGLVENWVLDMAGRATKMALNIPDVSVNSGPERQIDYSSGPALPTRTELWNVYAFTADQRAIRPEYWRLFTLPNYDGSTWSQAGGPGTVVPLEPLDYQQWSPFSRRQQENGHEWRRPGPRRQQGYDVFEYLSDNRKNQISSRESSHPVIQIVEARVPNIGFIPALPEVYSLRIRSRQPPDSIRIHSGNAINAGVLQTGQQLSLISQVSEEAPPVGFVEEETSGIVLSEAERKSYLALPERLLAPESHLKQLAEETLQTATTEENSYQRARRLSLMIQQRAVYTLRPPAIPPNADAAEYFLFQNPRGYCTYFAGALTVLCRSVGIPARVVSGFVSPDWDENGQAGILREANAHAWTEVWVDGWGWALVDATPLDNRGNNAPGWWDNWSDLLLAAASDLQQTLRANPKLTFWGTLALVPILLLIAARFGFANGLWLRLQTKTNGRIRLSSSQARRFVVRSYERAAKKLARRFRAPAPWETPLEWLAAAEQTLDFENPQPLRELTNLYLQAKYSPHEIQSTDGAHALEIAQQISWKTQAKKP